ncbi:MAG TPA: hypothetical protein VGH81_07515 [Rudaea sp.]
MTVILQMPADFPYADLHAVAALLAQTQVFVPGFAPAPDGLYSPESYLFQRRVNDVEFVILPDRNLASRMVRVGLGGPADQYCRLAAAVMAFAQCLDLNYEPSIAFHELAHGVDNATALEELRSFRAADQPRPQDWLDLALGRLDRMAPQLVSSAVPDTDMAKPLRRWNRNYILALKVAEMELERGPPIDKMLRLMEWMFSDFVWAGPGLLYASFYLAPSSPRKGMFKQLRSSDRERALAGVRNAAWDITHMSEFVRLVQEQGSDQKRYILATLDKAIAWIAPCLFDDEDDTDERTALSAALSEWWPSVDACTLADAFWSYSERREDPKRMVNRESPPNHIGVLIDAGEQRLRQWAPAHRSTRSANDTGASEPTTK